MTQTIRGVVTVIENPGGWWDVRTEAGAILAQFTTEFQARESGRVNARRLGSDLEIQQSPGPTLYWTYDVSDGTLKAKE